MGQCVKIIIGLNQVEEVAKNLNKVCENIIKNGGKEPLIKCVIYGTGNMAYQNKNGVYIFPITSLKY